MVGAHPQIAMLHEDTSLSMQRVVGKPYKGVKLCIPNHIRLDRRGSVFYGPLMKLKGIRRINLFMVESKYSIRDYQHLFPNLRILMIVRAPDQVVSSIQRHVPWLGSYGDYCYEESIRTMGTLNQEDSKASVKIVHFDSLVTNPESVMRGICSWLGCDYSESMLHGYNYMPLYERGGIDPSRASGGGHLELFNRKPGLKTTYLELCNVAI